MKPSAPDLLARRLALKALCLGAASMHELGLFSTRLAFASQSSFKASEKLALVIGNGQYQAPFDLPSARFNAESLGRAFENQGFSVDLAIDLDQKAFNAALEKFEQKASSSAQTRVAVVFYCGHGLSVNGQNLLLPVDLSPDSKPDVLLEGGVPVDRLVQMNLADPEYGCQLILIDACRTEAGKLSVDRDQSQEELSQLEAPKGRAVMFSTQAGRPALAPSKPDELSFFTSALIDQLMRAPPYLTFVNWLRLVKRQVHTTMKEHPLPLIRALAQNPFLTDNVRIRLSLSLSDDARVQAMAELNPDLASIWLEIEQAEWPPELIRLTKRFLSEYNKQGGFAELAKVAQEGAQLAMQVLRSPEVKLYRTSFTVPDGASDRARTDLQRAARGDKDASVRVARLFLKAGDPKSILRYEGWLQYASGLGNGIAAYELALFYRSNGQPALAAKAENLARTLGYSFPKTLDHQR